MTVLWAPEKGLTSKVGDEWVDSICDDSYVAIQLGLALELASNGLCHGSVHKVDLDANLERFSLASFFGPNKDKPLINCKTGEVIVSKYRELVKSHVAKTYED